MPPAGILSFGVFSYVDSMESSPAQVWSVSNDLSRLWLFRLLDPRGLTGPTLLSHGLVTRWGGGGVTVD